ncbi:hypothetical protein P4679_24740 [Priestia megaterium]|uniref:hypothetical protein n=1 Tax=Priestia megaterium TaxID=1404 RepID=UPI002E21CB9B|nr:hypothetical protein [Priestia megaterium]
MENFFKDALKVSKAFLIATIIMYIAIGAFFIGTVEVTQVTYTILFKIPIILLILFTSLGFIYSFFIKGKQKFIFLLLHFVSICVISFGVYLSVMLRDFAP